MKLLKKENLLKLFEAIGNETRLEQILTEFYERLRADIMVGFFFEGKDIKSIALKQKDFLLRAFGAKDTYSGIPPARAHLNLPPILSGHFDRRLRILEETLRSHKLSDQHIHVWIEFESSFRNSIEK